MPNEDKGIGTGTGEFYPDEMSYVAAQHQKEVQASEIGNFFRNLVGIGPSYDSEPTKDLSPDNTLKEYPSAQDAAFAQKYGQGYGTNAEPYIQEKQAQILGNIEYFRGEGGRAKDRGLEYPLGRGVEVKNVKNNTLEGLMDFTSQNALKVYASPDINESLNKAYSRAALVVDRIPVAKLGFDPSRIVVDITTPKDRLNFYGGYDRKADIIYMGVNSPETMVHESIHRGFKILEENNPDIKKLMRQFPVEEYYVRYLMHKFAGNPEEKRDPGHPQVEKAKKLFKDDRFKDAMNTIDDLVRDLIKKRKPMGPN